MTTLSRRVYAPQHDSQLLIESMRRSLYLAGRSVLDLCTGTGVVAIAAAHAGARTVTAFDICPEAVQCARRNATAAGVRVDVRLGSIPDAVAAGPYDVVLANPPYVPTGPDAERNPTGTGPEWAWNAGPDGRLVLDPLCDAAPLLLRPGGTILVVQSEFADSAESLRRLHEGILSAYIVARQRIPFGPVMNERALWLESTGALRVGRRVEDLVVVRAYRP